MRPVPDRYSFGLPERNNDGWFRLGNLAMTTTAILVALGVASMFLYAIDKATFLRLLFEPDAVRSGELWRLATWPLANGPSIWPVITMVFFWFVGNIVEAMLGRVRFTALLGIVTVIPAGLVSLLDPDSFTTIPEMGLSLLLTVVFVVFAAENPHAPSWFGIPVWVIAAVFIGINVLAIVGDRYWGTLIMTLLAIALALVVVRQWGFAERLDFIPQLGRPRSSPPRRGARAKRSTGGGSRGGGRGGGRGRVVEGPWSAPAPPSRPPADAAATQAELDALLDKIAAGGLDSLSSDEKRRLNELSKRLR